LRNTLITYAIDLFAHPAQWLFSAAGSKELTVHFVCSGGKAARTNEMNGFFRPAAGDTGLNEEGFRATALS
jgi:hypothetical protein